MFASGSPRRPRLLSGAESFKKARNVTLSPRRNRKTGSRDPGLAPIAGSSLKSHATPNGCVQDLAHPGHHASSRLRSMRGCSGSRVSIPVSAWS